MAARILSIVVTELNSGAALAKEIERTPHGGTSGIGVAVGGM